MLHSAVHVNCRGLCSKHQQSLAGIRDPALQSAVAASAAQLANAVREGISDGQLYFEGHRSSVRLSTKPWQRPEPERSHGSQRDQSGIRAWSRRDHDELDRDSPHSGRGMCAANCELLVLLFRVFQRLTAQAKLAGVIQGGDMLALTVLCFPCWRM